MKKIIILLFITGMFIFTSNVNAANTVDYKLTITDDFKFQEVINYQISDYTQRQNGNNPFADIVNDNVLVDILGKTKYKKNKVFKNGKYYVTLRHTYSEYSFSNSIFLNDCFENSNYDYNIDEYTFSGSGGFYCLKGDRLKITIITNMNVTSSNAEVKGNKYIWNPQDEKFSMTMQIVKKYQEIAEEDENHTDDVSIEDETPQEDIEDNEEQNQTNQTPNDDEQKTNDNKQDEKSNYFGIIAIIAFFIIISIVGIFVYIVLKQKKNNLNKI